MKRLFISIFLSLGIHALLMGVDSAWFKFLPQPKPHPDFITISLVALQPKGDIKAAATEKPSDTPEKKVSPVEKKETPPSKEVVKQMPEMPPAPKRAIKPVVPPVKTVPQQPTTQKETPIKKEMPKKKIKPKRNLKRLTKKKKKATPAKEVARLKPLDTPKPVSEPQKPAKKAVTPSQEKPPSTKIESNPRIRQPKTSGKESPSESTHSNESATLATKGDPSALSGLIMARPLYRKNPPPKYPLRARKKGYEGNVIIEVLVDKRGNVMDLKVFKSSGYEILDQSAMTAVKKWLFEPGTRDGKAAKMWVRVPIRFQLN